MYQRKFNYKKFQRQMRVPKTPWQRFKRRQASRVKTFKWHLWDFYYSLKK